jgi:hypothetical protein
MVNSQWRVPQKMMTGSAGVIVQTQVPRAGSWPMSISAPRIEVHELESDVVFIQK